MRRWYEKNEHGSSFRFCPETENEGVFLSRLIPRQGCRLTITKEGDNYVIATEPAEQADAPKDDDSYEDMSRQDLMTACAESGLKVTNTDTKADLIRKLRTRAD